VIPPMIEAAKKLGKRAGRAGRPLSECPYTTQGGGDQRAAARAWLSQWLLWSRPSSISTNFESDDEAEAA
jgi:ribosome modulation factor